MYIEEDKPELALADLQQTDQGLPGVKVTKAQALARMGRREEALRPIRPVEENLNPAFPVYGLAVFYALLGDEVDTVKWLERSRSGGILP
jgi:hypothetical protein